MSEPILELTLKGDDVIVARACGKCRGVARDEQAAKQCCEPYKCDCGADVRKGWTICDDCREKKRAKQERERFEKAEKLSWRDYEGPVFDGCDYHESVEMYLDSLACDNEPGDVPVFVWACTKFGLGKIDALDMIENLLDEHHEDASDWIEDIDGLQKSLDAWVEKQTIVSWSEDNTRAVLLDGAIAEIWPNTTS